MSAPTMRPGTVVRYSPDPTRFDPRWCREGIAIADERGQVLVDTYWGGMGQDSHIVTEAEAATVELLFHLDDYDEIERHGRGDRPPKVWETYHPDDRQRVTSQHGLQARYFIRKGAQPNLDTQIENARTALANAEHDVEAARRQVTYCEDELDKLVEHRQAVTA